MGYLPVSAPGGTFLCKSISLFHVLQILHIFITLICLFILIPPPPNPTPLSFSKLSTSRSRRSSPQTLTDDFVISSGRTWPPWLQLLLMYLVVSFKSKGCCVRKRYKLYRQLNLAKIKIMLSFFFSFFFSESSSSDSSPEFSRKEYSEYRSLTTLSGISIWTDLHGFNIFTSLSL